MPLMNAQGTNTALSTRPTAITGPDTWLMALMRGLARRQAVLDVMFHRLDDHDGVVHHDADGQHQAEQREVVEAEADGRHHGEGADDGHRHGHQGMMAERQFCRNSSTTKATRITASRSVLKTSLIDSVMKGVVS